MTGRQSEAATRGLALIKGGATVREAAAKAGVAVSTIVRACQRANISLPRGRRPAAPKARHET